MMNYVGHTIDNWAKFCANQVIFCVLIGRGPTHFILKKNHRESLNTLYKTITDAFHDTYQPSPPIQIMFGE